MLEILNTNSGDIFFYPLCFLRVIGVENETIGFVKNLSVDNAESELFIVEDNGLNVFVRLILGANLIEIKCGCKTSRIALYYKIPETHRVVRLLYVTCMDEEKFQGPADMRTDANEAVTRIQIGALLMQTFVAEALRDECLGRKSFKLEMTKMGMPKVFVIQLPITLQAAHELSERELWEVIAMQILSSPLASRSCKYLAFFCGTRFCNTEKRPISQEKEVLASTKGHVSLGGGGLAVVGTGGMYTWASSIGDILSKLRNPMKTNSKELMDFSAGRGTWGSCYGIHLGSVLHELCHTFDLAHAAHGIMSRGFEDFHIYFTSTLIAKAIGVPQANDKKSVTSMTLVKEPLAFTTDFIRKNIENISINVEPLKDPPASPAVYSSHCTSQNGSFLMNNSNTNDLSSPGFERFENCNLCHSQNTVNFVPKIPSPDKSFSMQSFSPTDIQDHKKLPLAAKGGKTHCRAFFSRSNAVFLAHHKWLNVTDQNDDEDCKLELKGSVLCSNRGIRVVELRDSRMVAFHHWEYLSRNPLPIIHIPWAQVAHWPPDHHIEIVAIDDSGCILRGVSIQRPL